MEHLAPKSQEPTFSDELYEVFGLPASHSDLFLDALRIAWARTSDLSDNHGAVFHGNNMWSWTLESVRNRLILHGWVKKVEQHFDSTISPDGKVALVVTTGDYGTGLHHLKPKVKREKGTMMVKAIRCSGQMSLFPSPQEVTVKPGIETWLFMYYRDRKQGVIRSEISLPLWFGGNMIKDWQRRIILPVLNITSIDQESFIPDTLLEATQPIIDIELKRRTK